ncbi:MAG: hypothetical protein ABR582_12195 [Gemmatimonadaceae bacterium]
MTDATGKGNRRRVHPPFAQPDPGRRTASEIGATEVIEAPDLPSIDQFVDDLPLIDEFLAEAVPPEESSPAAAQQSGGLATDDEGWAVADWQSYDWSGIASLGAPAPEEAEAHAAWSSTNWDSSTGRSRGLPPYEVAAALDEIARRIRSGDLSLAQFQTTPPEAAIAALFAALLRTKG